MVGFSATLIFAESLRDPVTFKQPKRRSCRNPADTVHFIEGPPGVSSRHLEKSQSSKLRELKAISFGIWSLTAYFQTNETGY